MRLRFIPVIDILATMENQKSSQKGTYLDAEYPVAFEIQPTRAVTVKWNPVSVVAAKFNFNLANFDETNYISNNSEKLGIRLSILKLHTSSTHPSKISIHPQPKSSA